MDIVITVLLIIILVMLCAVLMLLLSGKKNAGNDEELRAVRGEIAAVRTEILEGVQRSVKLLGEMLSENQRSFASVQSERLGELDTAIIAKQQAMNEAQLLQLKQLEERLKSLESNNEQKLDMMRETISKRLSYIQEDNDKKLNEIRFTVDEKLQKTLDEKLSRSFNSVSERLEQVYKGLGEMQSIAAGVGDLKKVLSNVKTRGILGEIQLGAILDEILAPEQYETNTVTIPGSANRVEFAVKLPAENGTVLLPIDSKFPGEAYSQLRDAYDSGSQEAVASALATLCARIKSFAKDIRDKYVQVPYTTNFGIMFLPFEGLYAEVVRCGLVETLQHDYNVSIAGPTTMAALLNSLQMGFRTLAIQKRSSEVWEILGAVKSEFDKFEDVLSKAQQRIRQVDSELDRLVGTRTKAISRKLRSVEKLDGETAARLLETSDITADSED